MNETEYRLVNDCLRVGSDGSVWSRRADRSEWRQLSVTLKNGNPTVVVQNGSGRSRRHVASIVLEAFVGPRPDGKKPIHRNGRKTDCSVDNLFWGERQRQSVFDDEVESDIAMLGESGIDEVLRYFYGAGVSKKSIAESMETEYRTIQYVIDTYSDPERIKRCLA